MARFAAKTKIDNKLVMFRRSEDGGAVLFSLFIFLMMVITCAIALDFMRFETQRTRLQNTMDRAVLASTDLQQTLDPQVVFEDHMAKGGFPGVGTLVVSEQYVGSPDDPANLVGRTATASAQLPINTLLIDGFFGIDTLVAPGGATATESISDVEISMVLDVSGSMGTTKLQQMKNAANDFVDAVIQDEDDQDRVSISIVPFATQVNANPTIMSYFNRRFDHDNSYCLDFFDSDFESIEITPSSEPGAPTYTQTAHWDWRSNDSSPTPTQFHACYPQTSRHILAWESDNQTLKDHINSFYSDGWTSIEIGTKWGAALLDPSTQPVLTGMIASGHVSSNFAGRPASHETENMAKVLIVMSDGANTTQWYKKDDFAGGLSPMYRRWNNKQGIWRYSWFDYRRDDGDADPYDEKAYYDLENETWKKKPIGGDKATQLTWQEVWELYRVKYFREKILKKIYTTSSWSDGWGPWWNTYYSIGRSTKDPRTSDICAAARDKGIRVYTIGFETGDTDSAANVALADCAGSPANFFQADGLEISEAFSAIATRINQLRLTQ